jgi:hypothetical protein
MVWSYGAVAFPVLTNSRKWTGCQMNINENVWVRLTSSGERQWSEHWNRYGHFPEGVPKAIQHSQREDDGRVRFQIHEIMRIFGASCYNGSTDLPFVDNIIDLT